MRIQIKGGVWKNAEDEILKAAVMKYGKNQWARISSLLVHKSAKQCKARWNEWLDPYIKKTEWSREEEEKLLHLAKLMPCQWRTIAPLVGRTAAQCLQHYEKLLDAASDKGTSGSATGDDPRRLRPGEIDPHPETKPARPDPVDMDEDVKEMLNEARARLTNTKGKKAKRKAREQQLEEARRLAHLQKRRELRAAGISQGSRIRVKGDDIDLQREIPFHRPTPAGFFDTSAEKARGEMIRQQFEKELKEKASVSLSMSALEGKSVEKKEAEQKKADQAKFKEKMKADLPAAMKQINALLDPAAARKRGRMVLPVPQMTAAELEQIAKIAAEEAALGSGSGMSVDNEDNADADADGPTAALLTNYTLPLRGSGGTGSASGQNSFSSWQTPVLGTPGPGANMGPGGRMGFPSMNMNMNMNMNIAHRTPAAPDLIRTEARNLLALHHTNESSLKGEENAPLTETDFSSAMPKRTVLATPNPLITPFRQATASAGAGGVASTPALSTSTSTSMSRPPLATHVRDALGLNSNAMPMKTNMNMNMNMVNVNSGGAANPLHSVMSRIPTESGDDEHGHLAAAAAEMRMHAAAAAAAAVSAASFGTSSVLSGLAKLPKAKDNFELVLPDIPNLSENSSTESSSSSSSIPEDAIDEQERRRAAAAAAVAAKERRASAPVRQALPRPNALPLPPVASSSSASSSNSSSDPAFLIAKEFRNMLAAEELQFPRTGATSFIRSAPGAAPMTEAALHTLADPVLIEWKDAFGQTDSSTNNPHELRLKAADEWLRQEYELSHKTNSFVSSSLSLPPPSSAEFSAVQAALHATKLKSKQIAAKVEATLAEKKAKAAAALLQWQNAFELVQKNARVAEAIGEVVDGEAKAHGKRLARIAEDISAIRKREAELQKKYSELAEKLSTAK